MAAIRYLNNRREGVWYFERRVPLAIIEQVDLWQRLFDGKRLWRKSLATSSQIEAMERGLVAAREFDALTAQTRSATMIVGSSLTVPPATETKILTPEQYKAIALDEAILVVRPWRYLSVRSNNRADLASEFEEKAERYRFAHAETLRCIRMRGYEDAAGDEPISPLTRAKHLNVESGWHIAEMSDRFGVLVGAVREGMIQGHRDVLALIDGAMVPPETVSPLIKDAVRLNKELGRKSPTLTDAVEHFIASGGSRGHLTIRTKVGVRQALREFIAVVGDKQLHAIDRTDVQTFIKTLGATSVGGRSTGSIRRLSSPATIRKKMTFLRAPVAMVIDHDKFDGANPFAAVRLNGLVKSPDRSVMAEKRAFEIAELMALFRYPWFTGCAGNSYSASHSSGELRLIDSRYWGPVVALYTGCRAAELGGLMLTEVRLDDPSPHIVVQPNQYRGTKSGKVRRIPLLDALLRLGFGEYVAATRIAGHDRLFPDWQPAGRSSTPGDHDDRWAAGKWPRAFNRTVIRGALSSFLADGARRSVTLHSFRGSFKRMLEDSGVNQQYVDDIVGHAKHELDDRYSGPTSIKKLYQQTHTLDFPDLNIVAPPLKQ